MRAGDAVLCVLLLATVLPAAGGPTEPAPTPEYAQIGTPDQAEGRANLDRLRQGFLPGEYYLEFVIRILPRRGDERDIPGRLWAAPSEGGPRLRLTLDPGQPGEIRWLIQTGPHPAAWRSAGAAPAAPADPFAALVDGSQLTPFDLQMAFLWWRDETLERVVRKLGRPADSFLFRPPPGFDAARAGISGVRAFLDGQFHAPLEIDVLGPGDIPVKVLSGIDLKKLGDEYLVKELDARDVARREDTRIDFTAAARGLDFSDALFDPANLTDSPEPPDRSRIVPFGS